MIVGGLNRVKMEEAMFVPKKQKTSQQIQKAEKRGGGMTIPAQVFGGGNKSVGHDTKERTF